MANDLISRKALVKALIAERDKYPPEVDERYSFGVQFPSRFNQAIRGGIHKALRAIETAPAVPATPTWISVKDRLPYGGEWVLVIGVFTHKKGGWCVPHVAEMRWGKWCAQDEMLPYLDERGLKITHWMPLPKPPITEEE